MFLTIPRHEILAYEGIRIPYSSRYFYDICAYRDKKSHPLLGRVTCELAYVGLTLLSLTEGIARIPLTLIAFAFSKDREGWCEGTSLAILTFLFSFYASICHPFVKNITETLTHFDCNLSSLRANQLLFLSCEMGQYKLAKTLAENHGADPHYIDEKTRVSPALAPHLVGMVHLQGLFALNEYEKSYLELKRLSHWLSIKGKVQVQKETVNLEGAPSIWLFQSLAESFQRFRTCSVFRGLWLTQDKGQVLEEALSEAYTEHSYEAIASRVQKGNLAFLGSGWAMHGICLSFYGNYMAIGNRGEGKMNSTLEVFKIDKKAFTPAVVEEILMQQHLSREKGENYFYHILPAKLSPTGRPLQDTTCSAFHTIAPKHNKIGVCALSSKKAVIRFAWALLLEKNPNEKTFIRAQAESKLYFDWAALQYLNALDLKKYPHHPELIKAVREQGLKKTARYTKFNRLLKFPWNLIDF